MPLPPFLFTLALVSATFSPAAPTVGDLVTIEFPAPVTLDVSDEFEIVEQQGRRVVVRTFEPRPVRLSGTVAGVRFRELRLPVRSVLRKDDDLTPAPLAPPKPLPAPRLPLVAIGAAAALAALVWLLLARAVRPAAAPVIPVVPAHEVYRRTVLDLRARPSRPLRWAALADATRRFLAATRPRMSSDLTTTELVPRLAPEEGAVADILRQGDLEKFSTSGAPPRDFDAAAARALELARVPEEAP